MKVLLTGCAGFIGSFVAQALLARGDEVSGVDNLSPYYDIGLKQARLERLASHRAFAFQRLDLADRPAVEGLFVGTRYDNVIHLAAQPGVRYSLENPHAYVEANLTGFVNLIEQCRHASVRHLVFASSSSVYGNNRKLPFSERDSVDHPISLYAATKKANELIAHTYAHLFELPCTGLRFFTVYGPWGRPDMSPFKFARAILEGEPIRVFNRGKMMRDFTYVDDVVEAVIRIADHPAAKDPAWSNHDPMPDRSSAPYRIYNVGNSQPVELMRYIEVLEQCLGRKAKLDLQPMQAGDVPATAANVSSLTEAIGFAPRTSIEDGVKRFVDWYRDYYKV